MKSKTLIYVIVGLVALVMIYFIFIKKSTAATAAIASQYGNTLTGVPITEAMIQKEMSVNDGYQRAFIQDKANKNGNTYAQQNRMDAIYMLQTAEGH